MKSRKDFPIKLNAELATTEVVWREERQGIMKNVRNTTLRRERFSFDDAFVGPSSTERLEAYMRYRTKRALFKGRGVATVVVACGEDSIGVLEPPVALVLGEGGGQGWTNTAAEYLL